MKLPYVFSDNALFLHSAPLDIGGTAHGRQVTVTLRKGGEEIFLGDFPVLEGLLYAHFGGLHVRTRAKSGTGNLKIYGRYVYL